MNEEDPERRREREFDAITFVLAGVLSAIVLGAVGYGVIKSSRGTATIPLTRGVASSPAPRIAGRPPPARADRAQFSSTLLHRPAFIGNRFPRGRLSSREMVEANQ